MSKKPDGTQAPKQSKPTVHKAKSESRMQRHNANMGNGYGHKSRGTARAARRAAGNFKPVNPEASLKQHPDAKYAKSLRAPKSKVLLEVQEILKEPRQ